MSDVKPNDRFRQARERLGLSHGEVAARSGVANTSSIWDIEGQEAELRTLYSPREIQKLCQVLQITPVSLFSDERKEPGITASELVQLIRMECHSRGVSLEQFGNIVGWQLQGDIEPAGLLLESMTIDGLQWLCRELRVDWHRVLLCL